MPIQHALWKVGTQPTPLSLGKLASEQALEDMIVRSSASSCKMTGSHGGTNRDGKTPPTTVPIGQQETRNSLELRVKKWRPHGESNPALKIENLLS